MNAWARCLASNRLADPGKRAIASNPVRGTMELSFSDNSLWLASSLCFDRQTLPAAKFTDSR
jgi:hypothetical protein